MATVIRATCDVPRACERAHVARGVGLVDARNRRTSTSSRLRCSGRTSRDVLAQEDNREELGAAADPASCCGDGRGRCRACRADQLREPRRDGVHGRVQRLDDPLRGGGPLAIDPLRIGAPGLHGGRGRGDAAHHRRRREGVQGPSAAPDVSCERVPSTRCRRSRICIARQRRQRFR